MDAHGLVGWRGRAHWLAQQTIDRTTARDRRFVALLGALALVGASSCVLDDYAFSQGVYRIDPESMLGCNVALHSGSNTWITLTGEVHIVPPDPSASSADCDNVMVLRTETFSHPIECPLCVFDTTGEDERIVGQLAFLPESRSSRCWLQQRMDIARATYFSPEHPLRARFEIDRGTRALRVELDLLGNIHFVAAEIGAPSVATCVIEAQ